MESGLEDRNNVQEGARRRPLQLVSMESGLEDRNNRVGGRVSRPPKEQSQWSPA